LITITVFAEKQTKPHIIYSYIAIRKVTGIVALVLFIKVTAAYPQTYVFTGQKDVALIYSYI